MSGVYNDGGNVLSLPPYDVDAPCVGEGRLLWWGGLTRTGVHTYAVSPIQVRVRHEVTT
jgi:hypothetical protein